jgi:hypothetical protein
MWREPAFSRLSASAKLSLFFLLTGYESRIVPGVACIGRSTAAADIGLEVPEFDRAFGELQASGFAVADWEAKIAFVPRAASESPPATPSVAVAWAKALNELADCALREAIVLHVGSIVSALGSGFEAAFKRAVRPGQIAIRPARNDFTQAAQSGWIAPAANHLPVLAGNDSAQLAANHSGSRVLPAQRGVEGVADQEVGAGGGNHLPQVDGNDLPQRTGNHLAQRTGNDSAAVSAQILPAQRGVEGVADQEVGADGRNHLPQVDGNDLPHSPGNHLAQRFAKPPENGVEQAPCGSAANAQIGSLTQDDESLCNQQVESDSPVSEANDLPQRTGNHLAHQKQKQQKTKDERLRRLSPPGSGTCEQQPDSLFGDDLPAVAPAESTPPKGKMPTPCPHAEIIELYHAKLPALTHISLLRWPGSPSSKKLATRWREGLDVGAKGGGADDMGYTTRAEGLAAWERFFERVAASSFLCGQSKGGDGWKADLHWLVCPTNFLKVLAGRYDDARQAGASKTALGKPSRLGVQPGDSFDMVAHFTGEQSAPEGDDHRALRFDGGLYLLGEDWLLLDDQEPDVVRETLDLLVPHGQVLQIDVKRLPRRVVQFVAMRRGGLMDKPDEAAYPLDPGELPAFPPAADDQRQEAA